MTITRFYVHIKLMWTLFSKCKRFLCDANTVTFWNLYFNVYCQVKIDIQICYAAVMLCLVELIYILRFQLLNAKYLTLRYFYNCPLCVLVMLCYINSVIWYLRQPRVVPLSKNSYIWWHLCSPNLFSSSTVSTVNWKRFLR